ncbi:hypothetical protein B0J17DRAFT_718685 [Rhizoctonia solani]|nr:hypothetical protein B0J17DRAFT_718685 [Rhizoctonia solani]
MPKGRSNSVVIAAPPIGMGGGCPNSIYLRVLWKLLSIFTNIVLFFYLGVATLIPSLVLLRRDPRGWDAAGSLLDLGGSSSSDSSSRRRARWWNPRDERIPPFGAQYAISVDSNYDLHVNHVDPRQNAHGGGHTNTCNLFSVVIQAEFMEAEVSATSCLEPAHSGTEGCVLQS